MIGTLPIPEERPSKLQSAAMTPDVFRILGTQQAGVFRVERVVAEGGFAVVYRAMHEGFRSPVALKCLKVPEAMSEEQREAFLEKFRAEGELLFRLSALVPAVVRPLHVGVLGPEVGRLVPFLALEWLDGEGLDCIIKRRRREQQQPFSLRELVDLLQPAAAALSQAHRLPTQAGPYAIIHRDLKPENIFVVRGQEAATVKILDFGIARTKSAAAMQAGRVTDNAAADAFTPGYAAPEQWMPKRFGEVGPWTDVFGLALTMVEALLGRPPVDGDLTAMMGTITDPNRRPTPRNEGAVIPDAAEAAFTRALAVDPRRRTQSIEAFWTEIEEALGLTPSLRSAGATPARAAAPAKDGPRSVREGPRIVSPAAADRGPASVGAAPRVVSPAARGRELDDGGPPVQAMDFELAAPVRRARQQRMPSAPGAEEAGPSPDFRDILRLPLQIIAAGIVVSLADWAYVQKSGEALLLGGVRPMWIAGPLVLVGALLAGWRVLRAV
ncbi:serine/threonine protein kinase [Minicystis rosea]|nr:serine/threonine protein kinase [Minicystis rosea]